MTSPPRRRFYITSAISYPNGPPHIGHAYEAVAADAIARAKRLDGCDVRYLAGADEHGRKVQQAAQAAGLTPQKQVDRITPLFIAMLDRLGCSHDDFVRTTEPRHHAASAELWKRMAASGSIYLGRYAGWYATRDEAFYGEDELAVDDEGQKIAPTGAPVEWMEEDSYFFNLSQWRRPLLDRYAACPDFIQPPGRRREVVSFVEGGLSDLSISRSGFDWGVPVPGDRKHVMYVWVDALVNYMTGVGFPDRECDLYRRFWPADLHLVGKDIVRFHAVYWPAFLMAADLPLPRVVFGHGHLFNRGGKMSKSTGNVLDPNAMIDAYGVDPLRYFLLRNTPFGEDGDCSRPAVVARINADLANDLGNLAQRTLTLIARHFDGTIPETGTLGLDERRILDDLPAVADRARNAFDRFALHEALEIVMSSVRDGNRYLSDRKPWLQVKDDKAAAATTLNATLLLLRNAAALLQPAMPDATALMLDLLGVAEDRRDWSALQRCNPEDACGTRLPPPKPVFPRLATP